MTVNIVMLVRNRPNLTRQALDSLFQHTEKGSYNLTVVDDASDLKTRGVLDLATAGREDVQVVRLSRSRGIVGLVRNLGIRAAETYWGRGDFLVCLDNDMYLGPAWLDSLLSAWPIAQEHGFALIGGYNHPYQGTAGIETGNPVPPVPYQNGEIREYYAVGSACWFMPWTTWDTWGPLDAHAVGVNQSEDWQMAQEIRASGQRVGCVHPHVALNCGFTSTPGTPAVGHEAMLRIPGLIME